MEQVPAQLITTAAGQGIWALLAVCLLFYVLRQNEKRESRYQKVIEELSAKFEIVVIIDKEIKELLGRKNE